MTSDRILIESTGRDPERLARYRKLIIFGKPAVAQALIESEAKAEQTQRSDRYTRPV